MKLFKESTKDTFQCKHCGHCCDKILPITLLEQRTIINHLVQNNDILVKVTDKLIKNKRDLSCPFRDEENKRCMIYNIRPMICREFYCKYTLANLENTKLSMDCQIININKIIIEAINILKSRSL